jgi:hypothetical protein
VRTTTREQALEALLARTRQEIACTLRRDDRRELPRLYRLEDRLLAELGRPVTPRRTERVQSRLADLGVSARQVKEWAVERGLIPAVVRGRISRDLVEAWAAEHRP